MQNQGEAALGSGHHAEGPHPAMTEHGDSRHIIVPGQPVENHPNALRYVQIALVLAALTALEITVYYVPQLKGPLVPLLLLLSAVKFALVVLFYMHLKFDNKLFSALFTLGLGMAASLMLGLLVLFHAFLFNWGVTG
jgi:cytochrome c oxidase subunit 4